MTYKRLQSLTSGLLTGDVELPIDEDVMSSLLEMAFSEIANMAESMHLMTLNRMNKVTRISLGGYVIRTPELPVHIDDELDIDNELCFPTARLIASYISKDKSLIHHADAKRLIISYNAKIYEILQTVELREGGNYDVDGTPVIKFTS